MTRTPARQRNLLQTQTGRFLKPTPIYEMYWRFAAERQRIFMSRVGGAAPPWTADPVLARFRFTNPYRASDRVSQYLIRKVIYAGSQRAEEIFFRTVLFRMFNRISTWETLLEQFGMPTWGDFDEPSYARALDAVMRRGGRVYSAAYIMPSPSFGAARKHRNHLRLLAAMMEDRAPQKAERSRSLCELFESIRAYPSFGDFLSYQLAIDINYGPITDFSEDDFVVPGPGALDGISKCFASTGGASPAEIIAFMASNAASEFERLGLTFQTLWGRSLRLIDHQNLFCEIDKYARVAAPKLVGGSQRRRIKRQYAIDLSPLPQWYPPKWGLRVPRQFTEGEAGDNPPFAARSPTPRGLHASPAGA